MGGFIDSANIIGYEWIVFCFYREIKFENFLSMSKIEFLIGYK